MKSLEEIARTSPKILFLYALGISRITFIWDLRKFIHGMSITERLSLTGYVSPSSFFKCMVVQSWQIYFAPSCLYRVSFLPQDPRVQNYPTRWWAQTVTGKLLSRGLLSLPIGWRGIFCTKTFRASLVACKVLGARELLSTCLQESAR